jgi:DNA-binding response OmpR family regulator
MARVLVIDDERDIRHLYAAELEDEGHQVDTAGSGDEALALLKHRDYDLVVLDIQLEEESGLELLQKIARERGQLPVILCTAFSSYRDDFSSWLADAYVVKSSDLNELKAQVRQILARQASR